MAKPDTRKKISSRATEKLVVNKMKSEERQEEQEKIQRGFLDRIAFLNLSIEEKALIIEMILEDIKGTGLYWIQLLISTLIATFGLLQNSVAVIIGAMLIAPLLRPIKGVSFGISTGQPSYFWKALKLQFWSMLVSITAAYVFTLLVPIRIETPEIIARTAPNLLDLFIAIASAVIAILAVYYKKLSENMAGVAMAAALLPALSVVGIEIALGNPAAAWGSLFLYLTNLFAILSVGVIIFLLYGFSPHQESTRMVTIRSAAVLFVLMIFISFPLFSSLTEIAEKIKLQNLATTVLKNSLSETLPAAKIDHLTLKSFGPDSAQFAGTIKIPEGDEFYEETREMVRQELRRATGKDVTFDVEVIPIAQIVSEADQKLEEAEPLHRQIARAFEALLEKDLQEGILLELKVVNTDEEMSDADGNSPPTEQASAHSWAVKIVLSLPPEQELRDDRKQGLEADFRLLFPRDEFNFLWVVIPSVAEERVVEARPSEIYHADLVVKWEDFFSKNLPTGSSVEHLQISWSYLADHETAMPFVEADIDRFAVRFDLSLPENQQTELAPFKRVLRAFASRNLPAEATVKMRTFVFQAEEVKTGNGVREAQ